MLLKQCSKWKLIVLCLTGVLTSTQGIIMAFIVGSLTNFATNKNLKGLASFLSEALLLLIGLFLSQYFFNIIKANITKDINISLRKKILLGMLNKSTEENSDKLSFLTNDFKLIEENRINAEISIGIYAFTLFFSIGYAIYLNWLITLIFLIGSLIPMVVSGLFQKNIQRNSAIWSNKNQQYVTQVQSFLQGTDDIQLYESQNNIITKNLETIVPLEKALSKMNISKWNANSITGTVASIFTFLFPFLVGIILVINNKTSLGALFAIVQLANSFINPIMAILNERNNLATTRHIMKKINIYLSLTKEIKKDKFSFNKLEFRNISLYQNDKKLISKLDIKINKGDKIAIIGPSGYGKSTLLKFILYGKNGAANRIKLNHQEIDAGNFSQLFSYSEQKPVIYADSVLFNLTLGKKISKDEIMQICKKLNLEKLIAEKGFDYNLGNNADHLSGGQLSRVSLARAILAHRDILLLDEINSSLDQATDSSIHNYLLNSEKTILEVIHHYDTQQLSRYTKIINLEDYIS